MACDICKGINSHLCPVCGKEPSMVERLAEVLHQWWYQGEREFCETCNGEGQVIDDRGPEDFFDEDAYMEARYERNHASL